MSKHVPRVFCDAPLASGARLRLGKEPAHHLVHVLRLKPGAALILFDGRGGEYRGSMTSTGKDWAEVEIGMHQAVQGESALCITLGQAISRGERMDYTLQKAVELGVLHIQPLDSERSLARLDPSRQEKKQRHWHEIVRSAAEQCGRDRLPVLHPVQPLPQWLQGLPAGSHKLLLDPQAKGGLATLPVATDICLLSGPEGGLSESEVELSLKSGFVGIRLGPRILRTETAAVACLAALQTLWGDLGK